MTATGALRVPRTDAATTLFRLCSADPLFARRYDMSTWEPLGRGGSADVVKLYCHLLRRDVAVKVFRLHGEDDARRRIPDEVMNPGRSSEYHVQVFGALENAAGDLLWIEMENVGPSLKHEMTRRQEANAWFTIDEALDLSLAAAKGVRDAHTASVIHRDIKPANFLVPSSGSPSLKLGDFGISKIRDAGITDSGEFPGTPEFAAPEVARGEATRASDVYSLGVTLFRLFTGKSPIGVPPGSPILALIDAHRNQTPAAAVTFRADVPAAISGLLARMLAKEPAHRPTAEQAVEVFEETRGRLRATTKRTPPPPPARKRRIVFAAWIAMGCLILGLSMPGLWRNPGTAPTPRASNPVATTALGPADSPSPSSQRIAPAMRLRFDAAGLWLDNPGPAIPVPVTVTLIGSSNRRHTAATSIEANSSVWLPLSSLSPPLRGASPPRRVELTIAGTVHQVEPSSP